MGWLWSTVSDRVSNRRHFWSCGRRQQLWAVRFQPAGTIQRPRQLAPGFVYLGTLRTAKAVEQQTILEAERVLDKVKSQVIAAQQASQANFELIDMAKQQVASAQEALRLTQIKLQTGTMTTLDVLEAGDALERARLRHSQAIVGYNQSQTDLLAAIGLLDENSVANPFTPIQ